MISDLIMEQKIEPKLTDCIEQRVKLVDGNKIVADGILVTAPNWEQEEYAVCVQGIMSEGSSCVVVVCF